MEGSETNNGVLLDEEYITRCTSGCVQSAVCPHRAGADGQPCPHELERYRRFVYGLARELTQRGATFTFETSQLVADAAITDLLIDRCARYLATQGTFYEEQKKNVRTDHGEGGSKMVKTQIHPLVDQMNKLYDRKHKVIRALTSSCEAAVPEDDGRQTSLAEFMQAVMETGKEDIYESVRNSPESAEIEEDWTLPGDNPVDRTQTKPTDADK